MGERAAIVLMLALAAACGGEARSRHDTGPGEQDAATPVAPTSDAGEDGRVAPGVDAAYDGGVIVPIRVGLITSLSGDLAGLGPTWVEMAAFAADEVNRVEGVLPGRPVELVVGDDATRSETALAAAERLLDDGAVALIGPAFSRGLEAVAELARERGIPVVSCCATSDALRREGPSLGGYTFRVVSPDGAVQGPLLARIGRERRGCTHLAILHENDAYGQAVGQGVDDAFGALGGSVPVRRPVSPGEPSSHAQVQLAADTLSAAGPGEVPCLVLVLYPAEAGSVLRELRELAPGLSVPTLASDAARSLALVEAAGGGELVDGLAGVAPLPELDSPAHRRLVAAFAAGGRAYPDGGVWPAAQYDAAALVLLALARTGGASSSALRDAVVAVSTAGAEDVPIEAADLAAGLAALRAGQDVDYVGASGPVDLGPDGYALGAFELWRFDASTSDFVTDDVIEPAELAP